MIGKVVRGSNVGGLLRYLYGPGRANEHTERHLVAGFGDPHELEPDRRADGSPDLRRLTGLLLQPLAADPLGGPEKPVWHCSVRAAPGDRVLSDAEWGRVAASVMERTGFAPAGDESGVRWVAVRHAADHVHIVATLARQDGGRVRTWNDFFRVRDACRDAERRLGLTATAPADRTAPKRASRAETEQAARRGWNEAPRVSLRREVCTAAAGASSEREFFDRLEQAGVLVRKRHSTTHPDETTGYSVGLAAHVTKHGAVIWYGGGKLAPDLTLPKLRARWAGPARGEPFGAPVHGVMARAVLRRSVTTAAAQARDEAGFFAQLRESGVLVRLRYSETNPTEVTGYAVALPGHTEPDGTPRWYGGGRLAAWLTLPRLRQGWNPSRSGPRPHGGAFRFTAPEREAFYRHAAREAEAAAEQIRSSAGGDPGAATDTAWAAAATFHATARAIRDPALRRAADTYDRAARAAYGKIPHRTTEGDRLRAAARLLAMISSSEDGSATPTALTLAASLVRLAKAVGELRQAQQHAAQAAAARKTAEGLYAALSRSRAGAAALGIPSRPQQAQQRTSARRPGDAARLDFPVPLRPGQPVPAGDSTARPGPYSSPGRPHSPPRRAGPAP
jgi:hypothetical protein